VNLTRQSGRPARLPWLVVRDEPTLSLNFLSANNSPQQNHKKNRKFLPSTVKTVLSAPRQKAESSITINFSITEPQKKQEVFTFNSKNSAVGTPTKSGDSNHH
jgi:hypothetical protein